jgi:hypothetical protein
MNRPMDTQQPPTDIDAKGDALAKACDVLSDEIEIARAAEQLATMFVDDAALQATAPAAADRPPPGIDWFDLVPLRVVLSRHVVVLTDLLDDLTQL